MQHSLHIFIGDLLSSVAEAVNKHLDQHCDSEGRDFSHVAVWQPQGSDSTVRRIENHDQKLTIADDAQGKAYFSQEHRNIVVATTAGDVSSCLYVCIYLLLYDDASLDEMWKIIDYIKDSEKDYKIDIYGIAEDLADIFCSSEAEKKELVYKIDGMKNQVRLACGQLTNEDNKTRFNHFLLIQGSNLNGLGLQLNRNSLIQIFGEYARLSTTNFIDLYPVASVNQPDVISLGISGYWLDSDYFKSYVESSCIVKLLKKCGLNQHTLSNIVVQPLISSAISLINDNLGLLNNSQIVSAISDKFMSLLNQKWLLSEKLGLLAMFLGKADQSIDKMASTDRRPTIDDCMADSINLFVEEHNRMIDESGSGPLGTEKQVIPLAKLNDLTRQIRQSKSYISEKEERLKQIERTVKVVSQATKRFTDDGFVFGGDTFKLAHDSVETPLEETYQPTGHHPSSIDLRTNFSPIRNQGKKGACTAFALSSMLECILNNASQTRTTCLSPRFLYYNVSDKSADGTPADKGSSFYDNIQSLGSNGICEENLCPYDDSFMSPPSEEAYTDAKTRLVTKALNVNRTHEALTSALAEGYPIGISLKVFDSFASGHDGFVFRPTENELSSSDFGYHAMVICGYSEKEKIYIVRNSWGEGFGDKGYCYIPFSYVEDVELCKQACIITGINSESIKAASSVTPIFNPSDDVEYAITRVLIDEEKVNLKNLIKEHDSLERDYRLLVGKLSNKSIREAILTHAIHTSTPAPTTPQPTPQQDKNNKTHNWVLIPVALVCALLSMLIPIAPYNWVVAGICLIMALIFGAKLFTVSSKEEEISVAPTPQIVGGTPHPDAKKELFERAGSIIDAFSQLRGTLSDKYKSLKSALPVLENEYRADYNGLLQLDEKIHQPFYSLFSKDEVDKCSDDIVNSFCDSSFLLNLIVKTATSGRPIISVISQLKDKIENELSKLPEFSMSQHLLGHNSQYAQNIDPDEIISSIKNMSTPFAQTTAGIPRGNKREIIFCDIETSDKNDWDNLLNQCLCPPIPCHNNDSSRIPKITYVKIQELDLDETQYKNS